MYDSIRVKPCKFLKNIQELRKTRIEMNKSTNKYRHKWVEPFDAPFTYICSKCGKHKIKETMYTATYYDENMNPLGSKSPECVSKQPSIRIKK